MKKFILTTVFAVFCITSNINAEDFVLKGKMKELVEKLDAKNQQVVLVELKKSFQENLPLREKLKANRDEIKLILKAPKFDDKAYLDKSDASRKLLDEMGRNRAILVSKIAQYFAPADRIQLVMNDYSSKSKSKAKPNKNAYKPSKINAAKTTGAAYKPAPKTAPIIAAPQAPAPVAPAPEPSVVN